MTSRMTTVVLVTLSSLVLGACGGSESDEVPSPEPVDDEGPIDDEVSTEPAGADDDLRTAIEAYSRTVMEGDPEELAAARSAGCAVVETELPAPSGDPDDVEVSDVDADIDGETATVDYRLDPAGQQIADERWVLEDGEWKWDNC